MTDSDKESENEAHSAEECSFTSTEEWIEDNISQKLDTTGVSGITIECNNPQSVSILTQFIFITAPPGKCCYCYHFTNEETETSVN